MSNTDGSAGPASRGGQAERGPGHHYDGDLRRTLLDAAAEAIVAHGVDAVSLRELARRAGVSHAAPAHHFGDKRGLHTALATEGFDLLAEALEQALEDGDGDPVEALVVAGREYVRFAMAHPAHFEVMFRPSLLRADDRELLRAADRAHGALDGVVASGVAAGWGRGHDPEALSALAWGVVHGLGALRVQGALGRYYDDPTLERITDVTRLFAASLAGPSPPASVSRP